MTGCSERRQPNCDLNPNTHHNAQCNSKRNTHSNPEPELDGSNHSYAQAPPDSAVTPHSADSPDTAAAASYDYRYCGAAANLPASYHTRPASAFATPYSLAAT